MPIPASPESTSAVGPRLDVGQKRLESCELVVASDNSTAGHDFQRIVTRDAEEFYALSKDFGQPPPRRKASLDLLSRFWWDHDVSGASTIVTLATHPA